MDLKARFDSLPERLSDLVWHWEDRTPQARALMENDLVWTFGELAEAVRKTRDWLVSNGVRQGDRVMIVNENCRAAVSLLLAASAMDAWAVIVNARLSAREVDTIAQHCGSRRVLFTVDVSSDAVAHAQRWGAEIEEVDPIGCIGVSGLNENTAAEPAEKAGKDQVAVVIYTSGTTGTPKGVMLSHRNVLYIAAISGAQRGLVSSDLVYGVLPIAHVFGCSSVFAGTLFAGACLMVCPRFSAQKAFADIDRGMTVLQGVPAMYARLIEHVRTTGVQLNRHRLRYLSAGGSPLDPAIKRDTEAMFGLALNNGYGMTEASPTISQTLPAAPRSDCSVGPALPFLEVRTVGPDGKDVSSGEVGEFWVRGPGIMKGYYRAPNLTAEAITPDGWLRTGDLGRIENDGYLTLVGRAKELIIRSGFNVYPAEVEAELNAHPQVTQSGVIGMPAADGNEDIVAFIQVAPGENVEPEAISAYCAERLAPYKRPSRIIVSETLPTGATGKILKHRLAALADETAIGAQQRQPAASN